MSEMYLATSQFRNWWFRGTRDNPRAEYPAKSVSFSTFFTMYEVVRVSGISRSWLLSKPTTRKTRQKETLCYQGTRRVAARANFSLISSNSSSLLVARVKLEPESSSSHEPSSSQGQTFIFLFLFSFFL